MDTSKSQGLTHMYSSPQMGSASPGFSNRRGNIKFSSAKFATTTRPRKGGLLSFRSSRRSAARPARAKGIFESLLQGFSDGIIAIKDIADNMKSQLPVEDETTHTTTRQHYYMDLEKNLKTLERKIRSLEVLKDRIEELKDEYLIKLKLRDGAYNLAQALANRPSKSAKEKLSEARLEQKELSEDLCDIEDELETKLGVFKVHINGFTTLPRTSANGEVIETQLKLSSQKWKARCKIGRHQQQLWQDNDIFLLCKVTDELFLKVVEVKRIQGNNYIGSMKCQTREFFSFFPQTVVFTLPSSLHNVKLTMEIRWSPMIGDDFLSDLDLKPIYCYVGAPPTPGPHHRLSNVSRTHVKVIDKRRSREESAEKIRLHTESPESSTSSYERHNVKVEKLRPKSTSDLLSKRISTPDILEGQEKARNKIFESSYSQPSERKSPLVQRHHRSSSAGSRAATTISLASMSQPSTDQISQGSSGSDTGSTTTTRTHQNISLSSLLESVLNALEEPKEIYQELRILETQLLRLQTALKGGRLTKAPSVTLSESNALDSFGFLESDDYRRTSQLSQISEGLRTGSFSDFISLQEEHVIHDIEEDCVDDTHNVDLRDMPIVSETTGSTSIDRILLQHLLHCEFLLQHLQSVGPLNHKLTVGIKKLYHEAEIIKDLLNFAADLDNMPKLEQILPELAACDHLIRFWKEVSAKDDDLCISCELFIVALDEKYGQILWNEFPEIANKVFSELLSRILDLEGDECDPVESKMSVTAFQFASFFLVVGSTKAIPKALKEIAQELSITEGLRDGDVESRRRIASLLPTYPFNHGALLAAAYLLSDKETSSKDAAVAYLNNFAGNSPWRSKAIKYYIEALEHSDQAVRIGACSALGQLKAATALSQLKYLAKVDFSPVKMAATQALSELGEDTTTVAVGQSITASDDHTHKINHTTCHLNVGTSPPKGKQALQRTRSAESALMLESNEHRTRL